MSSIEGLLPPDLSTTTSSAVEALYEIPAVPCQDRKGTVAKTRLLLSRHTAPRKQSVYGQGPTILSEITGENVVLGIDEAGRGSLVGPMIYGMAYWSTDAANIPEDFGDSKQINEEKRDKLFEQILDHTSIGFGIRVIPASEISRNMLRPRPYNLNQMSHDAAIELIRAVQTRTSINTCFIDTVGNAQSYQNRLEREFPGVKFVVESKADDNYASCSAASIVAKVTRDALLRNYTLAEPLDIDTKCGSGYPSDPACKSWVEQNVDDVFGFPEFARFSWAPAKQRLLQARPVKFEADQEGDADEDEQFKVGRKRQQQQMKSFLSSAPKRFPYFERRGIRPVDL